MTEQNGVGRSSATDELRRLLDERGVEWYDDSESIYWDGIDGTSWTAERRRAGDLYLCSIGCTSEQAVAATLGQEDTYTREDVEGAFVSGYSLGCLPVGSDPQWDENRQTVDEHMAELGWVRKDATTVGAGTCRNASNVTDAYGQSRFVCSSCDAWMDSRMLWNPEYPNGESPFVKDCKLNYCPNCGAKVVDE